jgi:hypothetical protein
MDLRMVRRIDGIQSTPMPTIFLPYRTPKSCALLCDSDAKSRRGGDHVTARRVQRVIVALCYLHGR